MNNERRTRVLVLIDWYLPGYKAGGPIQSMANLVDNLNHEYEFSIATRNTDYLETSPYPNIAADEWLDEGNIKICYISSSKLNYSTISKIILKGDCDIVYINSMFSYYFTLLPLWLLRNSRLKIVLAPRGMLAKSALGIKPLKKQLFLFVCSVLGLFKNIFFQATSEQEVSDIQKAFGSNSKISFAPNIPALVPDIPDLQCIKEVGSVKLISIARIAPEKNLLYALQVLKGVRGKVEFHIYGSIYAEQYWKSCEELIASLPENIEVIVNQGVSRAELFPLLQKSHFLFLPTQGENFGHIIMESLSCGCPVIISDQTPWKDLESHNIGYDISLSSEAKFVEAIKTCVSINQEEYDRKSDAAVKFARIYAENSESIEQSKALFSLNHANE